MADTEGKSVPANEQTLLQLIGDTIQLDRERELNIAPGYYRPLESRLEVIADIIYNNTAVRAAIQDIRKKVESDRTFEYPPIHPRIRRLASRRDNDKMQEAPTHIWLLELFTFGDIGGLIYSLDCYLHDDCDGFEADTRSCPVCWEPMIHPLIWLRCINSPIVEYPMCHWRCTCEEQYEGIRCLFSNNEETSLSASR